MDTFATLWDEAGDTAEAEAGLRALTSARIQVTPSWTFLAVAKDAGEFNHRLALVEHRIRQAAEDHGITFEALAKSLVDDFRETLANLVVKGSFYVTDGGKQVGGPYDTKADAQDAIDGGDVEGDDLQVSDGDSGSEDSGSEDSGDGESGDGESGDGESDSDDSGEDEGGGGNPFAKQDGSGDDPDDESVQDDDADSDSDDKGDNPFAKKESRKTAAFGQYDREPNEMEEHCPECGSQGGYGRPGGNCPDCGHTNDAMGLCPSCTPPRERSDWEHDHMQSMSSRRVFKIAYNSVVHQPGETVFVDHFMGHDEHEGRKGVWAQVVASPGQHGQADRADSHLCKPMAPGGTHFFHHFGSLQAEAGNDGLKYGTCGNCGDTNTKVTQQDAVMGNKEKWVGTDCSCKKKSSLKTEAHSGLADNDGYEGITDRPVGIQYPHHSDPDGTYDVHCAHCGQNDEPLSRHFDEGEAWEAAHGHNQTHLYGRPHQAAKTAIGWGQGPSDQHAEEMGRSAPRADGLCHGTGKTAPAHVLRDIQRQKGGSGMPFKCPSGCGANVGVSNKGDGNWTTQSHKPGQHTASVKTAQVDGVDPLALVVSTVSGEALDTTAALIQRFATVYDEFKSE